MLQNTTSGEQCAKKDCPIHLLDKAVSASLALYALALPAQPFIANLTTAFMPGLRVKLRPDGMEMRMIMTSSSASSASVTSAVVLGWLLAAASPAASAVLASAPCWPSCAPCALWPFWAFGLFRLFGSVWAAPALDAAPLAAASAPLALLSADWSSFLAGCWMSWTEPWSWWPSIS